MISNVSPTRLYRVKNKNKHGAANKDYNLIFLEDQTGDIVPLLLSDSDVSSGFVRASRNKEDIPEYRLRSRGGSVNINIAGLLCVLGFVSGSGGFWFITNILN